jgi:hypothetical protein
MLKFLSLFMGKHILWEYGIVTTNGIQSGVKNSPIRRRHRVNGNVQLILHNPWQHTAENQTVEYWYDIDETHWPRFVPYTNSINGGLDE